jgi:hypothetical protein
VSAAGFAVTIERGIAKKRGKMLGCRAVSRFFFESAQPDRQLISRSDDYQGERFECIFNIEFKVICQNYTIGSSRSSIALCDRSRLF